MTTKQNPAQIHMELKTNTSPEKEDVKRKRKPLHSLVIHMITSVTKNTLDKAKKLQNTQIICIDSFISAAPRTKHIPFSNAVL